MPAQVAVAAAGMHGTHAQLITVRHLLQAQVHSWFVVYAGRDVLQVAACCTEEVRYLLLYCFGAAGGRRAAARSVCGCCALSAAACALTTSSSAQHQHYLLHCRAALGDWCSCCIECIACSFAGGVSLTAQSAAFTRCHCAAVLP
jgi:hypothetical protein